MEVDQSQERRQLQRFMVKASALVQTIPQGEGQVLELFTKDISSNGAFFPMEVPLPTGLKVKITLFLSISAIESIHDFVKKTQIVTDGQVVRSTAEGFAVEFGKRYTISPAER